MQTEIQHKYHHDARPYAVASAESAEKARQKLTARFAEGKMLLGSALKSVDDNIPEDALVPAPKVKFDFSEGKLAVDYSGKFLGVHSNAYTQLLEKSDIPKKYADRLLEENPELLVRNLTDRFHKDKSTKTYLSRAVNGEVRGWLSDSYACYDVKPMVEAFLTTCMAYNAVPVQARDLATRFFLKMMIPIIYEPIPDEILVFGAQFKSSDYGDGAYDIRGFISRVGCTNDMMTEDCLRQVHLGAKLTAENFSQETLKLQAETLASATKDTVKGLFKPANIERRLVAIKAADAEQIKIGEVLDRMRRNGDITKGEAERTQELLTTSDVEVLPPVRTKPKKGCTSLYRFANAFSALANEDEVDPVRAMDFENIAGKLLGIQLSKKALSA